jgi:hypothetical protein
VKIIQLLLLLLLVSSTWKGKALELCCYLFIFFSFKLCVLAFRPKVPVVLNARRKVSNTRSLLQPDIALWAQEFPNSHFRWVDFCHSNCLWLMKIQINNNNEFNSKNMIDKRYNFLNFGETETKTIKSFPFLVFHIFFWRNWKKISFYFSILQKQVIICNFIIKNFIINWQLKFHQQQLLSYTRKVKVSLTTFYYIDTYCVCNRHNT